MSEPKMYVVVRGDLEPGLQAAQACHALREMVDEHPELDKQWHETSKTLVLLNVDRVSDLEMLVEIARAHGIEYVRNYEPDLGGELTAVTFGPRMKPYVRGLKLLLAAEARALRVA